MSRPTPPEFIRLDGHAVRVTSWTPLDEPGTHRLVTIVRGSADAALLADLLSRQPLQLEVPDEPAREVYPDRLERRDTGDPPATITRFSIDLSATPGGSTKEPATDVSNGVASSQDLEARVKALEAEVATLKAIVHALANNAG